MDEEITIRAFGLTGDGNIFPFPLFTLRPSTTYVGRLRGVFQNELDICRVDSTGWRVTNVWKPYDCQPLTQERLRQQLQENDNDLSRFCHDAWNSAEQTISEFFGHNDPLHQTINDPVLVIEVAPPKKRLPLSEDAGPKLKKPHIDIEDCIRNWGPPSLAARATEIFENQVATREDYICDGRGADFMEIPVRIYHSVYAHFLRTMETPLKDLDFTEIELDQAALLLTLFSARYEDKESRITAIRQALSTAVHPNLLTEKHLNLDRQTGSVIELDGAVFQICYDPVNLCYSQGLSALAKVTNEVGEGGCNPAARVAYYYAHISVSQFITDYIKSNSPRPSLLITITGPHLAVYGAVFVGRPVVQLLAKHTFSATENIDRRPDEGGTGGEGGYSSIDHGTLLVARLLRALRSGIDELQHYYSELPFPPQSPPVPLGVLQPHPWLTELETEGYGKVQLTYTQQMEPKKALFRARMRVEKGRMGMDDTAELDVVVKFTHSYHGGAHKLLAAQKLAPVLYH